MSLSARPVRPRAAVCPRQPCGRVDLVAPSRSGSEDVRVAQTILPHVLRVEVSVTVLLRSWPAALDGAVERAAGLARVLADKVLQPRCIECIVSLSRIGWAELPIGVAPRDSIGLSTHGKDDTAPPGGDVVDMELLYVPADATAAAPATV